MRSLALRFWRWLKSWLWNLADAFPPYRIAEGLLEGKETDAGDRYYVTVGSAKVEVDEDTFKTLVVGENLRVRYTRGHRAINIDRLMPGRGPG
ncbi:MAG: hypothetical protein IH956_00815 [Chloroflexi bacterium]|nr:hypothetical protein [Chloroflexota bacterium]